MLCAGVLLDWTRGSRAAVLDSSSNSSAGSLSPLLLLLPSLSSPPAKMSIIALIHYCTETLSHSAHSLHSHTLNACIGVQCDGRKGQERGDGGIGAPREVERHRESDCD